jgi:ABC-type lipoprotein export system ATPase subunit
LRHISIQTNALTRTYRRGSEDVHALLDVSLVIPPSAFAVVLGPSGSGKSTLLNLMGGIDRPTSGQLRVDGLELHALTERQLDGYRRDYVGFVFQFNNLLPNLDALENVALPLIAQGYSWAQARDQAGAQLAALGLGDRVRHRPAELSGGEQQRVALARAVIARPALVLADEPTGDLDLGSAEIVLDLMSSLNRDLGATFVIATHNSRLVSRATQVIELANGRLTPPTPQT